MENNQDHLKPLSFETEKEVLKPFFWFKKDVLRILSLSQRPFPTISKTKKAILFSSLELQNQEIGDPFFCCITSDLMQEF
jgi:hypothetical protein